MQNTKKQDQIKELVVARLQSIPSNASISIGMEGNFNRAQLIKHVEDEDEIGKKITQVELEYLKALKEGVLYAQTPCY